MSYEYTEFFKSVYKSVDRIEIKVNDIIAVQKLIDSRRDFNRTNVFKAEFHGEMYLWQKYKFSNCNFYFLVPDDTSTYFKPRILLLQPTLDMQIEMIKLLESQPGLYYKVAQLEITLDFVFKEARMSVYADDIIQQLDNSTYINWSRKASSFYYKDTKYRVNSNIKDISSCTKPIRFYHKVVNGKDVLRFELMLNLASADVELPFILEKDTIFKYVDFYKPNFNMRNFNTLLERMEKKGADVKTMKRVTNNFINRPTYTINEKIIKLKKLVKKYLPDYNAAKSIDNCIEEEKELKSFIINNLCIKGQ